MRCCRKTRVVAKHAQRAPAVPGLAELLHHGLQRRGNRLVSPVAVGDEGVVSCLACFREGSCHSILVDEMAKSWRSPPHHETVMGSDC
jgi:hypothetical protein